MGHNYNYRRRGLSIRLALEAGTGKSGACTGVSVSRCLIIIVNLLSVAKRQDSNGRTKPSEW